MQLAATSPGKSSTGPREGYTSNASATMWLRIRQSWLQTLLGAATVAMYAANFLRWRFLGDDAFISFRYAQNLARGDGLVWNPGEYVEGYTNFLWVLLLAGGIKLDIMPEVLAQLLGFASGLGILLTSVTLARRWLPSQPWSWWLPAAFLATNRSFAAWSSGGLETQLFAFLILCGFAWLFPACPSPTLRLGSATALGLATLTRPEGALFAGIAGLGVLGDSLGFRRCFSPRSATRWILTVGTLVGSHSLFRLLYYGELVPNTYHAKVHGFWWEQGLRYWALLAGDYPVLLMLPAVVFSVVVHRSNDKLLFATALGMYAAYVAAVGGDRFEFRFAVHAMPLFAVLWADGLARLSTLAERRYASRVCLWLSVAVASATLLANHSGSRRPEAAQLRHEINSLERIKRYADRRSIEGKLLRQYIDQGSIRADTRIAVGGAGALPYYSGLPAIDYFGLNDAQVARQEVGDRSVIGHEVRAPIPYLKDRGVIIFDILNRVVWEATPRELEDVIRRRDDLVAAQGQGLPLKGVCLETTDGRYLVFATPQGNLDLAHWFPGLLGCQRPK